MRAHKYKAQPTWVDNIRFASKKEAKRYVELRTLASGGAITNLRLQVVFQFFSAGIEIGRWVVDFTYVEGGKHIAEDPTGYLTSAKKRKIKLFKQHYPDWELRIS